MSLGGLISSIICCQYRTIKRNSVQGICNKQFDWLYSSKAVIFSQKQAEVVKIAMQLISGRMKNWP